MRMHFATIPVFGGEEEATSLNRFLGQHRVVSVDRQFVDSGVDSVWAVCVVYALREAAGRSSKSSAKPKVDYREVLSDDEFRVFSELRVLGKALAARDAVPAYAVFTNQMYPLGVGRRGSNRVNRGGSFANDARNCRAACRNANHPGNRWRNQGFRLARAHRWDGCPAADQAPIQLGRETREQVPGPDVQVGRSVANGHRWPLEAV